MWTHCRKETQHTVLLRDYIGTLLEAETILREQYAITEQELKMEKNPGRRRELEDEFNQIQTDHRFITAPFKLPPLRLVEIVPDDNGGSFYGGSQRSHSQRSQRQGDSVIFAYEHNNK